jgi:hypothetical protein
MLALKRNEYSSNNAREHSEKTGLNVKINDDFLTCLSTDAEGLVDEFMQSKSEADFIKRINLDAALKLVSIYDYRGDMLTDEEFEERQEDFLDTLRDCAGECYRDISRADDETNEWFEYVDKYKKNPQGAGE